MAYDLIAEYKLKLGDNLNEVITLEGLDENNAALALPAPTRASLHIRQSPGGTVLARLDSDAASTPAPNGTIAIAATATGGIQLSLNLAGTVTALWTANQDLVGDLQLKFAAGAILPSPWTCGEIHLQTYADNTEVS